MWIASQPELGFLQGGGKVGAIKHSLTDACWVGVCRTDVRRTRRRTRIKRRRKTAAEVAAERRPDVHSRDWCIAGMNNSWSLGVPVMDWRPKWWVEVIYWSCTDFPSKSNSVLDDGDQHDPCNECITSAFGRCSDQAKNWCFLWLSGHARRNLGRYPMQEHNNQVAQQGSTFLFCVRIHSLRRDINSWYTPGTGSFISGSLVRNDHGFVWLVVVVESASWSMNRGQGQRKKGQRQGPALLQTHEIWPTVGGLELAFRFWLSSLLSLTTMNETVHVELLVLCFLRALIGGSWIADIHSSACKDRTSLLRRASLELKTIRSNCNKIRARLLGFPTLLHRDRQKTKTRRTVSRVGQLN